MLPLLIEVLVYRTKEVFIDGWVRTGDEVKVAKNGDYFVVDRLKVSNLELKCYSSNDGARKSLKCAAFK